MKDIIKDSDIFTKVDRNWDFDHIGMMERFKSELNPEKVIFEYYSHGLSIRYDILFKDSSLLLVTLTRMNPELAIFTYSEGGEIVISDWCDLDHFISSFKQVLNT